ncbi:MAG: integrase family protein [Nitrospinota bacterium]|nr:integrase family protein [Nitrospinota bacterium]
MAKMKITKSAVDGLPPVTEPGKSVFYWDKALQGFGVKVVPSGKVYVVQSRVSGRSVRVTLGKHGKLTPDQARSMALQRLSEMTQGVDPMAEKQAARAAQVTLREAFDEYMMARKQLKPRTVLDYRYQVEKRFGDWLGKQVRGITKNMIQQRHADIAKDHGPAQGNQAMRVLRAVFNFAMAKYETNDGQPLLQVNPVKRLSETRAWYKVDRKRTYIKDSSLGVFLDALDALRSELMESTKTTEVVPDYLELILFTGLRRQEAAHLKWADVDMAEKTFTITDTKNSQPLTLPMSDMVYEMLDRRRGANLSSEYVFPDRSKTGHLMEPRRQMKKITAISGVKFTVHDLRRTFATVAESLDISGYALKRLLNHKQAGDVTEGYIVHDAERLRAPMQRITDAILTRAGRKGGADVLPFKKAGGID